MNLMNNSSSLIIIFVKNAALGKVKTRLAKTVGEHSALDVYQTLVTLTESASSSIHVDRHIYFSEEIDTSLWKGDSKHIQQGRDLGEKMMNAFMNGFTMGYERIVLIGSDLPEISEDILQSALSKLQKSQAVFGPAQDGGYYLIGLTKMVSSIFTDKPWSTSNLLALTLSELKKQDISIALLKTLNDIDTFEDLCTSEVFKSSPKIQKIINTYIGHQQL